MRIRRIGVYRMNSAMYYLRLLYDAQFARVAIARNGTIARALNALRALAEWKFKRSFVRSRPFIIRLEPSVVCNLKCPGCITPTKTLVAGQTRMMTVQTFEKLLRATHKLAMRMTFYMEGEPTTNPWLFDMIRMAASKRLFTSISTNFTLMREQWLDPLFRSGLDYLSVCLDGYTQESYELYRINGDVSKVKNGLRKTMDYKRQGRFRRPFVNVYSIMFGHVVPQMPEIEAFCRQIGVDQLTFRPDECNFDGTTPQVSAPKPAPLAKCYWPWMTLQVDADGSVYPCAISFQHEDREPYGNIATQKLGEIWNNDRYRTTREYLAGRISEDDPRVASLPCHKCRWYGEHRAVDGPRTIELVESRRSAGVHS